MRAWLSLVSLLMLRLLWAAPALAFAPDGSTLDWVGAFGVKLPPPPHLAQVGPKGEASLSIPLSTPPARVPPGLSLDYDARAGADRELPWGWRIGGLAEIVRPNQPRAFTPDEWVLSGPGFGGRLDCAGGPPCVLVHTTPDLAVQATYDRRSDAWTVETSEGLVFHLSPGDGGAASGVQTSRWRATSWEDPLGNAVEVAYDAQGRVSIVSFGGNPGLGEAHTGALVFTYGGGAARRTQARGGFVEVLSGALQEVTLWVEASGAWAVARSWELGWTAQGGESATLLDTLRVVGDQGLADPPMRFTWSSWTGATRPGAAANAFGPVSLSRTEVVQSRYGDVVNVFMDSAMVDVNGDGLLDHLETDTRGRWWVTHAERDASGALHWAGGAQGFSGPAAPIHGYSRASGLHDQVVRLVDFDGDGLPDLVSTTAVRNAPSTSWAVWYGTGAGFSSRYVVESAPATVIAQEDPWANFSAQALQALIDVNGDGWQDLVRLSTSGPAQVAFHSGRRGGGLGPWVSADAPWCDDMGSARSIWCGLSQVEPATSGASAVVTDIHTRGGFADVNGDGLPDYVIDPWLDWLVGAPASAPWTVYLGTGAGWASARHWEGPSTSLSWRTAGAQGLDQRTLHGLMDVDGDGLPDLVEMVDQTTNQAAGSWYANLGDGFDTTPRATPAAWLRGLSTLSVTESTSWAGGSEHHERAAVLDLDGDGVPDSLHLNTATFTQGPLFEWGEYPGPHLLVGVDTGAGRRSTLSWAPGTAAWPAGDPSQAQFLHIPLDLVSEVSTEDLITGQRAWTRFTWLGGVVEDLVFLGFEGRDIETETAPGRVLVQEEDYALTLELPPELLVRRVYTDACRGFAPALQRCAGPRFIERIEERLSWSWWGHHRLVRQHSVRQEADDTGGRRTWRRWTVQQDHDDAGHLVWLHHDGGDGGALDRDVEVELDWVRSGVLQRVREERVHGWDALAGVWREHRRRRWDYDGTHGGLVQGLLTEFGLASFWHEAGESPTSGPWQRVELVHGPRGEVMEAHEHSTGLVRRFTWTRGASLVETEHDGVHLTRWTYDVEGRPVRVEDVLNGLSRHLFYDGLGRATGESVEDSSGVVWPLWSRVHQRGALPFTVQEVRTDGTGQSTREQTFGLDGGGHPALMWSAWPGGGVVEQGFTHDLQGQVLSRTTRCWSAAAPSGTQSACPLLSETWFDALGQARVVDREVGDAFARVVENPSAWEVRQTDEEGFLHHVRFDAFGRPEEVSMGREDSLTVLARYEYDPLGRLVAMTDEAGVRTVWSGDGAGRVRAARGPDLGERRYRYQGPHLVHQEDSAGGWASWQRDGLGRVLVEELSDPLLGVVRNAWTWDRQWAGASDGHTDPFGHTRVRLDALGRAVGQVRAWPDGAVASWSWGLDLEGRTLWSEGPSGRRVTVDRDLGFPQTVSVGGQALADLDWDAWGRLRGLHAASGVEVLSRHTPHGELEFVEARTRARLTARSWTWKANGLMHEADEGQGPSAFRYDDRMQLLGVQGPWTEGFTYHPGGDLDTQLTPAGGSWTWSGLPGRHAPATRSDGTQTDAFTWDSAGRLSRLVRGGVVWEMRYDGLGRLRAVLRDGSLALVLERDAQGAIVRRVEGDPADAQAPVEHAFGAWRRTAQGSEIEQLVVDGRLLGFWEDHRLRWVVQEPGGAVAAVVDEGGRLLSERGRSAYGGVRVASGVQDAPGLHGHREEPGGLPLLDAGVRHLLLGEGLWLQPEPLLLERPQGGVLLDPLRLHPYRYARNTPTTFTDPDGRVVDVIADVAFIGYDVYRIVKDPSDRTNWAALGADCVGAIAPGVVAAGLAVRAAAVADKTMDGANALGKMAEHGDELAQAGKEALERAAPPPRLPQDVAVNPTPPSPLPAGRPVGKSPTQNAAKDADVASARAQGATDIRVNQQQVNAAGERVGVNRPDLQYTDANGNRVYIEYDSSTSTRGPGHQVRIESNDPSGTVILKTED